MPLVKVLCFCVCTLQYLFWLKVPTPHSVEKITEHTVGLFLGLIPVEGFSWPSPSFTVGALHSSAITPMFYIIIKCLLIYIFFNCSVNSLRPTSVDYLLLLYVAHGRYPTKLCLFCELVNQINKASTKIQFHGKIVFKGKEFRLSPGLCCLCDNFFILQNSLCLPENLVGLCNYKTWQVRRGKVQIPSC